MDHQQLSPSATLDLIIRTRFATLLLIEGLKDADAAKKIGCATTTVTRRTAPASDTKNWRAVKLDAIDTMLEALDIPLDRILQPVLMDGDKALLKECRQLPRQGSLPDDAILRFQGQGLVVLVKKDGAPCYQLTPLARRTIR